MEDLTLALVTLTSFVLLFVIAIFADRAGAELEEGVESGELARVTVDEPSVPVVDRPITRESDVA